MLQRINNLKMCYSVLYNNGMGKLQKNRDVYATFNSLYLVISNILLTHTHTHRRTVAKFLYKYLNVRARGIAYNLDRKRNFVDFLFLNHRIRWPSRIA